jgi:hypothetical protein
MRVIAGICAILIVAGFFGITATLMFREVVQSNTALLNQMLGALTLAFGGLMGYLYGRSSASDVRTRAEAQAKVVEAAKPTPHHRHHPRRHQGPLTKTASPSSRSKLMPTIRCR